MTTASDFVVPRDSTEGTTVSKRSARTVTSTSGNRVVQYRPGRNYFIHNLLMSDRFGSSPSRIRESYAQVALRTGAYNSRQYPFSFLQIGTSSPQVKNSSIFELDRTIQSIKNLRKLSAGWNGYDVPAPDEAAIEEAVAQLDEIYRQVQSTPYPWQKPAVSADENGSAVLEWEIQDNGLTLYISQADIRYLLDWGFDTEDEMEYGVLTHPSEIRELWERLNH